MCRLLNFTNLVIDNKEMVGEYEPLNHFRDSLTERLSSIKSRISNTAATHKVHKLILEPNDKVYAKYWPNKARNTYSGKIVPQAQIDETSDPSWHHGRIRSLHWRVAGKEADENNDGYGPCKLYDVMFDLMNRGEYHSDIDDHQVILDKDYILSKRIKESERKGVNHVVDKTSKDPWARDIGWYVTRNQSFVHLALQLKKEWKYKKAILTLLKSGDSSNSVNKLVQPFFGR